MRSRAATDRPASHASRPAAGPGPDGALRMRDLVRQSGLPALRLASLSNVRILEEARAEALALYERDPALEQPEHRPLAEQVARFWQEKGDLS